MGEKRSPWFRVVVELHHLRSRNLHCQFSEVEFGFVFGNLTNGSNLECIKHMKKVTEFGPRRGTSWTLRDFIISISASDIRSIGCIRSA